ncbi:MAG: hypothetical protein R2739_06940 [Chitinophagales bacterium]|nr:hypothetical protein [Bacteroidota bacterium]
MRHYKILPLLFSIILCCISFTTQAQCAMCKGSVQTSQYAKSINGGIEYLLCIPILLVAGVAYIWVKKRNEFQ